MMAKTYLQERELWRTIIVTLLLVLCSYSDASLGACDNSGNIVFNCSGAELTAIPSIRHVPSYYQTLDLSNNYISNITRLEFPNNNSITTLLLTNNRITKIEAKAFEQMTNLVTLDLSRNNLEGHKIKEKQFYDLRKLTVLQMERNPLSFIGTDTYVFSELFSLKHLDLSHGAIKEIESGAIDLPSLEYLDLSWNELNTFHKDSFRMLVKLETLDLSHNHFTILDQLPHLPNLKVWILDNNQVSNVSVRDEIQYLAYHLEHLYIRNNDISRFTADSFPWKLESLKGIYLDNNPIECDCRMKWAIKDVDIRSRNFTVPCQKPSKHKGKNLFTIAPDDLKCGIAFLKMLLFIGIAFVVILCFIALVYWIVRRSKGKKGKTTKNETQKKTVDGSFYTAVYTKEKDEVEARVHVSDRTELLHNEQEEVEDV